MTISYILSDVVGMPEPPLRMLLAVLSGKHIPTVSVVTPVYSLQRIRLHFSTGG